MPTCTPCLKEEDTSGCVYPTPKLGAVLRKGQSCIACRQRKKKCDAGRPVCNHCRLCGTSDGCVYEDTKKKLAKPSGDAQRREILPVDTSNRTHHPRDAPSDPPRDLTCVLPTHLLKLHPLVAAFMSQSGMPPNLFFSAVSNVSLDDLSLVFRIIFDSYRLSVGLLISEDQRKALIRGDMQSGAIHGFFIHYAHIWGCHLYQQFRCDFVLLFLQSIYVYMAIESLTTIREKENPVMLTQALLMTSEMYFHTHHPDFGLKYLEMAAGIVKKNGLRFVMHSQNSAHGQTNVTEDIRQRVGLLSQLLYVETELFLLTGRSPDLFEELEAEFKFDLAIAYPRLSKMCPIVMRARGVLLIKDAVYLKNDYDRQSIPNKGWFSATTDLIKGLDLHARESLALMDRVQEYQKGPEAICLRCDAITSLVTIAELYDRVCDSKQDDQYSRACMDVLCEISSVTQGLQENEYHLLDPYIGACWNEAVALMRKHWKPIRIEHLPPSDSSGSEGGKAPETSSQDPPIDPILRSKSVLVMKSRLVPAGPGSLCAKLVAMNEKLRTRCPDRVAPDEVNKVFRY